MSCAVWYDHCERIDRGLGTTRIRTRAGRPGHAGCTPVSIAPGREERIPSAEPRTCRCTVLPLTAAVYAVLFSRQWRDVFRPLRLRIRKNWLALLAFLLVYQVLMSAVSVRGYFQELLGHKRRWE